MALIRQRNMYISIYTYLVFLGLFLSIPIGSCDNDYVIRRDNIIDSGCSDPLQCYLSELVIPLPNIEADGIEITQLVLSQLTLEGLPSNYDFDSNLPPTLNFGVNNLGRHLIRTQNS